MLGHEQAGDHAAVVGPVELRAHAVVGAADEVAGAVGVVVAIAVALLDVRAPRVGAVARACVADRP